MTVAVVSPARPEDGRWTDFAERALRNIWPPALLSFDATLHGTQERFRQSGYAWSRNTHGWSGATRAAKIRGSKPLGRV